MAGKLHFIFCTLYNLHKFKMAANMLNIISICTRSCTRTLGTDTKCTSTFLDAVIFTQLINNN